MPAYKLVFKTLARTEEAQAALYYQDIAADLGLRFLAALGDFFDRLAAHPHPFGYISKSNTLRDGVLESFPFRVVFGINGDMVLIHSIRHTARKPYYAG